MLNPELATEQRKQYEELVKIGTEGQIREALSKLLGGYSARSVLRYVLAIDAEWRASMHVHNSNRS